MITGARLTGLFVAALLPQKAAPVQADSSTPQLVFRNTGPGVQYVGSKTCAACHPAIASSYTKTAMGRSLLPAKNFALPNQDRLPFRVFDSETNEYFEVSLQEGEWFQTQYALDSHGKDVFRQTWKIDYVVGSGEGGIGFLIHRDGFLFEAPLSYYSQSRLWSFSPGYERHNYGFTRPVVAECMSCHSGRPQPVYATDGLYRDPPFKELAVGCENCHGPGALHVTERSAGQLLTGTVDSSIVNPSHLSGWLSDNICMKCHQAGDVRVEQPGKHDEDFRPGTALENVVEILKARPPDSKSGNPVLLEHYYSMILSKCYRSSSGKLHCTTCHDPHLQPSGTEAVTYYRNRCLSCHESHPCKLKLAERERTTPPDNCVSCHMPKRAVVTIAHAALTEHRIVAKPEEGLPEEAFHSTDPDSGLIRLTAPRDDIGKPLPDTTLLRAYAKLIHDGREEFRPRMNDVLDRLMRISVNDSAVLSALARREVQKGTPEAFETATEYLNKSVRSESASGDDFLLLAELDSRSNKHKEAIEILEAGMRKSPYLPQLYESIAAEYVKLGDYRNAMDAARRGLELFPDDKRLRTLMDKVRSASLEVGGSHSL